MDSLWWNAECLDKKNSFLGKMLSSLRSHGLGIAVGRMNDTYDCLIFQRLGWRWRKWGKKIKELIHNFSFSCFPCIIKWGMNIPCWKERCIPGEAWPTAWQVRCDFVFQEYEDALFPPWGLLVVFQYGAIGGSHYFQLVKMFLKSKNFWKRLLEGVPTQFFPEIVLV